MKSKFSRIAIFRDEFCSKVSSWGKKRERRERERGRERETESLAHSQLLFIIHSIMRVAAVMTWREYCSSATATVGLLTS